MKTINSKETSYILYGLLAVLLISCIWATVHAVKPIDQDQYQEVTVEQGDTLWGIALNYTDKKQAPSFITWVKDTNHVQSDVIRVGDKLVIPVKRSQTQVAASQP